MMAEPRTSFVGRARLVRDVEQLVRSSAVVTLTGAGGIGKTRLALRVAEVLESDAVDGRYVVELAPLAAGAAVAAVQERVASATGSPSFTAATDLLRDATALIVIDNAEHVLDAAAEVVETLVALGTEVRVLNTSRVPLEVDGELLVDVDPLSLEDSLELLLERARSAGAAVAESRQADADLRALAAFLDGHPLALELAASRLRALAPADVIDGLEANAVELRRTRGAVSRHLSIDGAVAWSYQLLDPEARRLFRSLSVFPGWFDLEGVMALAEAAPDRFVLSDALDQLVAHSLIRAEVVGGRLRYRMLVPIRQPAMRWLEDAGEYSSTRERLIDHLVGVAVDLAARGVDSFDDEVMGEVFSTALELRTAARWCLALDASPERAFALFLPSYGVVHHADVSAVARLGDELLERWPDLALDWGPEVHAIAATAQLGLGELDRAAELSDAVLAHDGDPLGWIVCARARALVEVVRGDFRRAAQWAERGSLRAREAGLDAFACELDSHHGGILSDLGQHDAARDMLERSRDEAAAQGATVVQLASLHLLAENELHRDLDRVEAYLEATDALLDGDSTLDTSWSARLTKGFLHLRCGDHAAALRWMDEALQLARRAGDRRDAWRAVRGIAIVGVLGPYGIPGDAVRVLRTVATQPTAPAMNPHTKEMFDRAMSAISSHGPTALMNDEEAVAAALELASLLRDAADVAAPANVPAVEATLQLASDHVVVTWAGSEALLKPMKGLVDLARLVAWPGREMHVLELMGSEVDEAAVGPDVDEASRRAYEDRLRGLQVEIDEAEGRHDEGRLRRAQDEFDQIVEVLSAALGLGGRDRQRGASAERARQAVAWRLKSAIRKLEQQLPACGRHLRRSIRTGAFCSYDPEADPGWTVTDQR